MRRATSRHLEEVGSGPVCAQHDAQHAGFIGRLEHHRTGAVTKEHARGAVGEIDVARESVGTGDEHAARPAGLDGGYPCLEREDEAGTRGVDVVRRAREAEQRLCKTCGGREDHIGARGAHDEQIDVSGGDAGISERPCGGPNSKMRRCLTFRDDPSLPDAGTRHDPLIRGLDHLLEFLVGEYALRQVRSDADDAGACIHGLMVSSADGAGVRVSE